MRQVLDFGTQIDRAGEPYSCVLDMKKMIPDDHRSLFSYIRKREDIEMLDKEVCAYAKGGTIRKERAVTSLKEVHPYYQMFPGAAVYTLNCSLASAIWQSGIPTDKIQEVFEEKMWGKKELPGLNVDLEYYAVRNEDTETLEDLSDSIYNAGLFVTMVLDDSNPELKKLPSPIRNSMYGLAAIRGNSDPVILEIPVRYTLPYSEGIRAAGGFLDFDDDFRESLMEETKRMLDGELDHLPDKWSRIAEKGAGSKTGEMETSYVIHTLGNLISLELYFMVKAGIQVNRCQSCGRLFPVNVPGQRYCDFRKAGKLSHFQTKEYSRIYNRAYKTHFARIKRGAETKEDLESWKRRAKEIMADSEKNQLSFDRFEKMLKEI